MRNMRRWLSIVTVAVALAMLSACGGGGGVTDGTAASEVQNEVARASVLAADTTTIDVPMTASGLAGARVEIPADAALEDVSVQVGYENAPPGPFRAEAVAANTTPVSKTVVLKVANAGPSTFNKPVTVTIPYDTAKADGLPPAVLYWDHDANEYRTATVTAVDRTKGTVTFLVSHFSKFMAVVVKALNVSIPEVDTGFRVGVDSILHTNFGSYQYGGHCAAFASMSTHFYSLHKATKLYSFAQEPALEQPVDDELTRTALTMTYSLIATNWSAFAPNIVTPSMSDTGLLMIESMIATGNPLHLVMHSGNAKDGGHSVTAYAYDSKNARFRIYDSNFPKEDVAFDWNLLTGFGTYSKAAVYPSTMFDNIGYASDDTFGAPAQFQQIIAGWENGRLSDYFSNLKVTDSNNTEQSLDYGKSVTVQIPYLDNQSVTGRFVRPAGSTKPVYLHVYYDGTQQSAVAPAIDPSGNFTLSFPAKLDQKVEVMLLVSEHPRSANYGFTAFGKFSVQPEGKNFFTNFGFETGDITGWSAQTTLRYDGSLWTPTKIYVVNVGFDSIASDIPTVQFGAHSAQINDFDPSYHTTFIQQTATIPTTGNPQLNFKWAAVLEDPQHSPTDQPYVDVAVVNLTRSIDLYRKRFYTNDPTFGGWNSYQGGQWKAIPWQSVMLTGLSSYAGDQIQLRIDGADCDLGGHGGYVYLDGEE